LFVVIPSISSSLAPYYNQNKTPDGYDMLAENVVAGNGYRFYPDTSSTMMREPGYPLLLAGVFYLFGDSFAAVKLANIVLALIAAALITILARQITDNDAVSFGAAVLFLFHPGTLIAESRGGVEVLFSLCLVVF